MRLYASLTRGIYGGGGVCVCLHAWASSIASVIVLTQTRGLEKILQYSSQVSIVVTGICDRISA